MTAARALLSSIVDYAGLFPPAALELNAALSLYQRYRSGPDAWMLGRFVAPAAATASIPADVPLSVLGTPAELPPFDTLEVKAAKEADVAAIAKAAGGRTVYVEVADPALIQSIAAHRLRAKIRTGGVTADAFPPASAVAEFVVTCARHRVPFKATAGLHHPVRGVRPLTYADDAPRGTMHGFLNVFFTAALVWSARAPMSVDAILLEEDPRAFTFTADTMSWRDRTLTSPQLSAARAEFAIAFGSCSFEEPVNELREMGVL